MFPEKIADFDSAVSAFTRYCVENLAKDEEPVIEEVLDAMDKLQRYHPALWFKVYRELAVQNLAWADELASADKESKFLAP